MNIPLEELSDFWQDVLYVRCNGNRRKARTYLVYQFSHYPHSSEGNYSGRVLRMLGRQGVFSRNIRNGNMKWR